MGRTGPLRRAWRLALAALLVAALVPGSASAGRADKGTDRSLNLFCEGLTSGDGTLFLGVGISETEGVFAWLEFWASGDEPFVDPPTLTTDYSGEPTAAFASGVLAASIPVVDDGGSAAGSATISASLAAIGDPIVIDEDFRDGNRQWRASGTIQPFEVTSGTASLPDGSSFDLTACFAEHVDITFFGTNPASYVSRYSAASIGCELTATDGSFAFLDVFFDGGVAHVSAFGDGFEAFGSLPVVDGTVSGALDVFIWDPASTVTGASIGMSVASTGESFEYTLDGGTGLVRVQGELYDVAGSLALTGGPTYDLGDCVLRDQTWKTILRSAGSPSTSGRPPANDAPSGATLVPVGSSVTQSTKSASPVMEEPFDCLVFEDENGDPVALPVLNTVWYRFTGTGGPVTIDTAGTSFDTVLAVYTADGSGGYAPLPGGCVDDMPVEPIGRTLQAAVTVDTLAGVTYYVQAGGFPDDLNWGTLKLSVR